MLSHKHLWFSDENTQTHTKTLALDGLSDPATTALSCCPTNTYGSRTKHTNAHKKHLALDGLSDSSTNTYVSRTKTHTQRPKPLAFDVLSDPATTELVVLSHKHLWLSDETHKQTPTNLAFDVLSDPAVVSHKHRWLSDETHKQTQKPLPLTTFQTQPRPSLSCCPTNTYGSRTKHTNAHKNPCSWRPFRPSQDYRSVVLSHKHLWLSDETHTRTPKTLVLTAFQTQPRPFCRIVPQMPMAFGRNKHQKTSRLTSFQTQPWSATNTDGSRTKHTNKKQTQLAVDGLSDPATNTDGSRTKTHKRTHTKQKPLALTAFLSGRATTTLSCCPTNTYGSRTKHTNTQNNLLLTAFQTHPQTPMALGRKHTNAHKKP